jgi:TetR/AcrR family transcriptional repressor of nem operon
LAPADDPFISPSGAKPYRRCSNQYQEKAMRKGEVTRERILDVAEDAVLAKGFGATSIEEIIAEAGITKSGFFYHFADKNVLARAMMERYIVRNNLIFETVFARADDLADGDSLQSLLIGLKLLAEQMADLPNGHPGCLVASVVYQERLFDRPLLQLTAESVKFWNEFFRTRIEAVVSKYPALEEVDAEQLARMIMCGVDGGIIMGKVLRDPSIVPGQLLLVRSYLKLIFRSAPSVRQAA